MADNRKEQERSELYRTIWNIANDLRGSVDSWDFKQYVLGMLFYRYISENITAYINAGEHEEHEAGNTLLNNMLNYRMSWQSKPEPTLLRPRVSLSSHPSCLKMSGGIQRMMKI